MIKILFMVLFLTSFLNAHKLNLFTTYENESLYINTYFANGKACINCKVIIKDENQKVLMSKRTDKKGELFIVVNKKYLVISVDAGSGHIVEEKIFIKQQKENEPLSDIIELENENKKLKARIVFLENEISNNNIFKTIFALLVIVLIFAFLKRIKSE